MLETLLLGVMLFLGFASTALCVWALLPDESRRLIQRRIYSEISTESKPSFIEQVGKTLTPLNRRLPSINHYSERTTRILEAAGLRMAPLHFLTIQEMGAITGLVVYLVTIGTNGLNVAWLALFMLIGFFIPVIWLNNRIHSRKMTVARDLPEVSDLLNLCVGAGMDFMNAMTRIIREFRPCPVREELGVMLHEVRVGKRRRDALRAFAARLKSQETSTFARTLIQADRMGTGLVEALQILAEDMRLARYHWAERFAQQAPVKMLVPLILSLGSAMIIVAGPILVQFFREGFAESPRMTTQSHMTEGQGQ